MIYVYSCNTILACVWKCLQKLKLRWKRYLSKEKWVRFPYLHFDSAEDNSYLAFGAPKRVIDPLDNLCYRLLPIICLDVAEDERYLALIMPWLLVRIQLHSKGCIAQW